jgi:hypothetical protein
MAAFTPTLYQQQRLGASLKPFFGLSGTSVLIATNQIHWKARASNRARRHSLQPLLAM